MKITKYIILATLLASSYTATMAQQENTIPKTGIASGAEFLLYNTDVRSSAMGNIKSIGMTDAFSLFSNPAKLSYQEDFLQNDISVSYSPVLPELADDMNIFSAATNNLLVSGNGRENYLAFGFQYFSIGGVELTDLQGNVSQYLRPHEMAFNIGYSTEVIENLHIGAAAKAIYSKLIELDRSDENYQSAFAAALDLGILYNYPVTDYGQLNVGYTLKNIGTKLKYNEGQSTGLPTTMNLGVGYTGRIIDDNSYFFIGAEANKPFISSEYGSTSPLPIAKNGGVGFSIGGELMYKSIFSALAGYDVKSAEFGGLNYITMGIGINTYFHAKKISFTGAYMMPTEKDFSPGNVYRIGLSFSILEN